MNIVPTGGLACLIAKATTDESNKWHRRLGHVNFKNLNKLVKGNLVRGLPSKIFQNDHTCVACQKGKQHKASCKAKAVSSISQTLQLLHMDLFGPTSVRSLNHKTYCLVITDDFSRFSWVFFLRTKDETSAILKDFIRQIENQLNQKVKTIRSDNGTEFKNKEVIEFCGIKGIKREYSNARTPQQNGVAERKNRTLIEAIRTMLADSFLPNTFWAEAVSIACYVLNRVLVTKPHNKTPYELLTGKIPIISYIRPFGCHVTILNTIDHLGKFAGKSDEGFLVGYSLQSKAFRVYNLETKRVEENLHITFLENKPNVAGKGPTWLFDLDYLTDSMNYHPVSSENQANLHAGQQEANQNAGTEEIIDVGDSDKEDDSAQDCFVLPIWPSYSSTNTPAVTTDDKRAGPREEEQVFMDDLERLKKQEKEAYEEAEALRKKFETLVIKEGVAKPSSTNIFSTVSTPAKASSTNPLNTASIPVSTASPYEGLSLADPTHSEEDDSEIPPLEDIYQNSTDGIFTTSSFDDEGAVADFTNLETVVNVSPIPTSRIHSTHPRALISRDSKLSSSNKKQKDFKALVMKAGLMLCNKNWLQFEIQKVWVLVDLPYGKKAIGTKWVYQNKKDERGVVVRNKARLVAQGHRQEEGIDYDEMNSMGELTFFLGLQVKQKEDGIFISQDKYVADILKKFDFANVKTASTPIETQKPLVKDKEANDVNVHLYRFQLTPKSFHLSDVKRIFRNPQQEVVNFLVGDSFLGNAKSRPLWLLLLQKQSMLLLQAAVSKFCGFKIKCLLNLYKPISIAQFLTHSLSKAHSHLQALISLLPTIYLSRKMAVLDSCPKHNMVAYLEKSEGNAEFHEIIDFLKRSSIHHALTSCLSLAVNRSDLLFDDADGIDSLPNQAIFDAIQLMGKVFSFMVKKGKHFSGKVTPLFATMLVQPTQDEGASSERPSEAQPTPSPAPTSEVPHEPQTDSSPAQTSEVPLEHQTNPSPRSSPTTTIPDSIIPKKLWKNLGGKKISSQGRAYQRNIVDHMETENAQNEGRTREMVDEDKEIDENILSTEDVLSTDKEGVLKSTMRVIRELDKDLIEQLKELTEEHIKGTGRTKLKVLIWHKKRPSNIEEEDESKSESDGIPEAEKKFKQLESDEEMARKIQEEWEAEEEETE
ncbi:putative ribonuclease H-like domain-containing protein [Tanacetum coccineum]|uniref:Ribonuclease H-like domain-containing protein n=1 Tax=Tanacetum coccineum TaxID=301880 RepID=A0ABQ5AFJ9_9ASTR